MTLTIMSFIYGIHAKDDSYDLWLSTILIATVSLYLFGFTMSTGPIIWIYNADILPFRGVIITTTSNYFFNIVVVAGYKWIVGID